MTRNAISAVAGVLLLALVAACAGMSRLAWTQSNSQESSLGDLARKERAAKASKNHVFASRVLNGETAPHDSEKQTKSYWATIPPSKLTINIPVPNRAVDLGIEVPIGKSSAYIAFGETVWTDSFEQATQEYLSMLLTRSLFRGAKLRLGTVEDTAIGGQAALLVHFDFAFHGIPHQGLALFVSAPHQVMGLGCMHRSVDWEKASSLCEGVINSAEVEIPTQYKLFKKPFQYDQ